MYVRHLFQMITTTIIEFAKPAIPNDIMFRSNGFLPSLVPCRSLLERWCLPHFLPNRHFHRWIYLHQLLSIVQSWNWHLLRLHCSIRYTHYWRRQHANYLRSCGDSFLSNSGTCSIAKALVILAQARHQQTAWTAPLLCALTQKITIAWQRINQASSLTQTHLSASHAMLPAKNAPSQKIHLDLVEETSSLIQTRSRRFLYCILRRGRCQSEGCGTECSACLTRILARCRGFNLHSVWC